MYFFYEMYIGWCLGAYNDNYLTFNVYLWIHHVNQKGWQ